MLSVLIPIYNFDIRQFVNKLHLQAVAENIEFEIILADDVSELNFRKINKETENLEHVKYIQLKENIGRSKIRNFLAKEAKYDNLIFADCDTAIAHTNFIHKYLIHIKDNSVICGGITYSKIPPENSNLYLRWFYGINREKLSAEKRNKNPYISFMSGNFFITKKILSEIQFDENIREYGHEDTLFGIEMKRKNISVKHIDNQLIHCGLENSDIFIKKTETGIDSLIQILKNYSYPELKTHIKLLKISKKLYILKFIIVPFFNIFKKLIIKNLQSQNPKLFIFDFYKLAYFYKKNGIIIKK